MFPYLAETEPRPVDDTVSSTRSHLANVVDDPSTGYRHNLFRPGMKSGGTKMQRAFVIRPFGKKTDASGTAIDFEQVHEHLIAPALKDAGLGGGTTGEIIDAGNVREDMFSLIIEADPRGDNG